MATSTTNLGLTKPSVNDAADIGVLNSNFDKIDTAVAGKANSWYGLGEIGVYCSDCNNAQRNGWFCIDTNTANLPDSGVSGTLFVETRPSSYGVDVYQTIKSGVTVSQRYYSSWAGTWQPWEYVNPPMQVGVEYRTTERHNGKAVYTKLCAYAPSAITAGYQSLPTNASWTEALSAVVRWYDASSDTWRFFPSVYHGNIQWMGQVYSAWGNVLVLELGTSLLERMQQSTKDIYITLKYIKD
jgi:hypothetical protein